MEPRIKRPFALNYVADWQPATYDDALLMCCPNKHQARAEAERHMRQWLAPILENSRVAMDLGCGIGRHVQAVTAEYLRVTMLGSDASPAMLKLIPSNIAARWQLLQSPCFPFLSDQELDALYSIDTLGRLDYSDVQAYLADIARVLKTSGRFMGNFPNFTSDSYDALFGGHVVNQKAGRLRGYTADMLTTMCRRAGLEVEALKTEADDWLLYAKPAVAKVFVANKPTATWPDVWNDGAKVFNHSGDLGDIIYGLPVIKSMGGGHLLLTNSEVIHTREPMTEARTQFLRRLFLAQPYIKSVTFRPSAALPKGCVDLNTFRRWWADPAAKHASISWLGQQGVRSPYNLTYMHLAEFRITEHDDFEPWLQADPTTLAPVVIHRSPRYHNRNFDWRQVLQTYAGQMVFVGLASDHQAFCKEFQTKVPFYQVKDAQELAQVIAGATLFVGNGSLPLALAEGMRCNILHECTEPNPDTVPYPAWSKRPASLQVTDKMATPIPLSEFDVLFTVNVGDFMHYRSRESMQKAAQRWGCRFVEWTQPIAGLHPAAVKTLVFDLVTARRVFLVDADCVISPNCPSPFQTLPQQLCAAADAHLQPRLDSVTSESSKFMSQDREALQKAFPNAPALDTASYFNTGVLYLQLFNHRQVLRDVRRVYRTALQGSHWYEQSAWNFVAQPLPKQMLHSHWNFTNPTVNNPSWPKCEAHIYHFAGLTLAQRHTLINQVEL